MTTLPQVYIDDREDQSRRLKALLKLPGEPLIKRLPWGDYVCGDVAVEYKAPEDMISSIIDNRVFNECSEIREHYSYPYLIIAGNVPELLSIKYKKNIPGKISVNQYLGAVASLSTYVNVLVVNNENQALNLISKLFSKHYDCKVRGVRKPPLKDDNTAVNYLSCIKGVSVDKATIICETLNVGNLHDLLDLTVDDLVTVSGVGLRTAEMIIKGVKK